MHEDKSTSADPRALSVLFDTYWTPAGWRDQSSRSTAPEDLVYAKRAGVMFDPIEVTHDAVMKRAIESVHSVTRQGVANAFVVSLSTRRLELRSALGSFAVHQYLPWHEVPPLREPWCDVCGDYAAEPRQEDLSILNFARFKWGGVCHHQPLYTAIDLELFAKLPVVAPDDTAIGVLKELLAAIEAAPPDTSSATLQRHLGHAFKSNKAERDIVVGILGYCGILGTPEHPGFLRSFIPWSERELPARRFVDMAYPACWWQQSIGINHDAVAHWFGHLL